MKKKIFLLGALLFAGLFISAVFIAYRAPSPHALAMQALPSHWIARSGEALSVPACGSSSVGGSCSGGTPVVTISWSNNFDSASDQCTSAALWIGPGGWTAVQLAKLAPVASVSCAGGTYTWTGGAPNTLYSYLVGVTNWYDATWGDVGCAGGGCSPLQWADTLTSGGAYTASSFVTPSCGLTPTPTPTPPPAPAGISGSCPIPGSSATVSWASSPGATYYDLRVDDLSNGWTGSCASVNPGDVCIDGISGTSYSFGTTPGNSFSTWVHACNAAGCSSPASASFTCASISPTPTPTPTLPGPTPTPTPVPTLPGPTPTPTPTPTLVPPVFDFSLSASAATVAVQVGSSGSNSITATLLAGSAVPVSYSVSGLPSGANPSFSSPSCTPTPTCSTTLTISTSGATPTGSYLIFVTANDGAGTVRSTFFTLDVSSTPPPPGFCGDGIQQPLEQCDQGSSLNGPCPQPCSVSCTLNSCPIPTPTPGPTPTPVPTPTPTPIPPPVSVSGSASPTSGNAPFTTTFSASASGGAGPISYSWSFSDGGSASGPSVSHTFSTPGNYSGTVTATDGITTGFATVSVTAQNPATLTISPTTPAPFPAGTSFQLTAYYDPDGPGGPRPAVDVTAATSWSSSDSSIAIVSGGLVTGLKKGTVTISAVYNDLYGPVVANPTATVTILLPPPKINLTAQPKYISTGGTTAIQWSVSGASTCSFTSNPPGDPNWDAENATYAVMDEYRLAPYGDTVTLTPPKTTIYTISCSNTDNISASANIRIIVGNIYEPG